MQLVACLTTDPVQLGLLTFVEIDHEIISMVILPFLLILEGTLSRKYKVLTI